MTTWVNGRRYDDPRTPVVSAFDHGMLVGDGVFETVKVVGGRPFALRRHVDRLLRSAKGLGLVEPDRDQVNTAVNEVLADWPGDGRLRITYTSGFGPPGSARGDEGQTLIVAIAELTPFAPSTAVATVPWTRNEHGALAGLKTTSYADNVVALAYARERGASEALFANTAGQLCEGTGSNIFVVRAGEVLTPPLSSGCLAGVTRDLVLQWCGGIERDLPMSVLDEADEIFLVSTTRDVQPVHRVDDRELAPTPGPVTERVRTSFLDNAARNLDP